jgi:hypothetical protein
MRLSRLIFIGEPAEPAHTMAARAVLTEPERRGHQTKIPYFFDINFDVC